MKEAAKNSSRQSNSEFNNYFDQTKINNQQKIIENIQHSFGLIAKVTDDNTLGIGKTNDNLGILTADFERLINVITQVP